MKHVSFVGGSAHHPVPGRQAADISQRVSHIIQSIQDLHEGISGAGRYDETFAAVHCANAIGNIGLDVRQARKLRQLRKRLLGEEIFSGAPWDILLLMFESHMLQRRDTIGNICDGTELPATTALRWISKLEAGRMIRLRGDPLDRRRRFVELSDSAIELMTSYFNGVAPHVLAA